MPFEILFVCTGNVCRSPAAAALTRAGADPDAQLRVHSAGLSALTGTPIDGPIAEELNHLGVTADEHRARQYEPWMALDAGLVLTATRAQAEQVLRDVPQAFRRVFTLKEFDRLAERLDLAPGSGATAVVAAVAAMRGRVPVVAADDDDVADPYKRPRADVQAAIVDIAVAVHGVLAALELADTPRRRPMPYRR